MKDAWHAVRVAWVQAMQGRSNVAEPPQPNLQAGAVVTVFDLPKKRTRGWPKAKVDEVYTGKDGAVRKVTLRLPDGRTLDRHVLSLGPVVVDQLEHPDLDLERRRRRALAGQEAGRVDRHTYQGEYRPYDVDFIRKKMAEHRESEERCGRIYPIRL